MRKDDLYLKSVRAGKSLGRYLVGKSRAEEEREAESWKSGHGEEMARMVSSENIRKYVEWRRGVRTKEEWRKWNRRRRGRKMMVWFQVAACLMVVIGGVGLWNRAGKQPQAEESGNVEAGRMKATLYANGRTIEFGDSVPEVLWPDSTLLFSHRVLRHMGAKEKGTSPERLLLSVPRGGEFETVLEDGTRVWLNADSKLRYPSFFDGGRREVELEGEAYFDVARDTTRPFIVRTGQSVIQVFGTEFNVKAYPDEREERTTLVEGSVGLRHAGKVYMLRPNDQAVVEEGREVRLTRVDARKEGLWRTGMFVFERETLESLMGELARWYNVTVFYTNERLKTLHFSGELDRYEDIGRILHMVGLTTDVTFSLQGRTVIVSSGGE